MKTKQLITVIALLISVFMTAQSGMNWSAIISDDTGKPLPNQAVDVKFTLNDAGAEVYTETHSLTTSENGFAYAVIGTGTSATNFLDVEWKKDFNLKVEVNSGNGYQLIADKPLQAVPYAKYAQNGLPKATRNQFLNFDGTEWKGVDNFKIIDNQTVGINTHRKIGKGNLIVSGGDGVNEYAGVYANHINTDGKPFFGLATEGDSKAWIEYDGETSSFKIYNNDDYKFTIDNAGDVLINNLEGTGNASVMVNEEGKLYREATQKTKYTSIAGGAFNPLLGKKHIFHPVSGVYIAENVRAFLTAPVNLPDGVKIKNVTVVYRDNSTENLSVKLVRFNSRGYSLVMGFESNSKINSFQKHTATLASPHIINNEVSAYYIEIFSNLWPGTRDLAVLKVIIEYEE